MKIFISHIHEEAKLALILKDWIETTFSGNIAVFVSSDIDDIPAGSNWLEKIDNALNSSSLFLQLCSPISLSRPWINFEAGCAWIKKVPLIPICHSGTTRNNLPSPISFFQAIEIETSNFTDNLFQSIKQYFKISKLPHIDKSRMMKEIGDALQSINTSIGVASVNPTRQDMVFDNNAIMIINYLANVGEESPTNDDIARNLDLHPTQCQYYLDNLLEHKIVFRSMYVGSPSEYGLSSNGRKYAVENRLL